LELFYLLKDVSEENDPVKKLR